MTLVLEPPAAYAPAPRTSGSDAGLLRRPVESTKGFLSWVTTVDHKRLGIMYGCTSMFWFLVGGIEALFIRLQLAAPNSSVVGAVTYNGLFTMHATTMVFLVVMPHIN